MLKKPEVGQTVVTGKKECCGSGLEEGTIVRIAQIFGTGLCASIRVKTNNEEWYHCPECLRRPKKGETL